jgi:hypothetical protein
MLDIDFHLSPPTLAFEVHLRLRQVRERWVAESVVGQERSVGLGPSPRAALVAALEPLGGSAVGVLLADLGLLPPSLEIVAHHTLRTLEQDRES